MAACVHKCSRTVSHAPPSLPTLNFELLFGVMMSNDRSALSNGKETMATSHQQTRKPRQEHSVPWFWPLAAAIEFGEEGMRLFQDNVKFLAEAHLINAPPPPEWATPNRIDLELD